MENTYDPLKKALQASGQDFSMANLKGLAGQYGMSNYGATDAENRALAQAMQAKSTPTTTPVTGGDQYAFRNPEVANTQTTTPTMAQGMQSPYFSRATPNMDTEYDRAVRDLTNPKDFAQYRKEEYDRLYPEYSSAINAITQDYTRQIEEAQARGRQLQGATRAQGAAFGLSGSPVQWTAQEDVSRATGKAVGNLQQAREAAILSVVEKLNNNAEQMAQMAANRDLASAENTLKFREKAKAEAIDMVGVFSKQGISGDVMREKDPRTYQTLLDQVGGNENYLNALFAANTPPANIVKTWNKGSTMYQLVQNPGQAPQVMSYDVGVELPTNWETKLDSKGNFIAYDPQDPTRMITRRLGGYETSAGGVGGATYTPGANTAVDSWIRLINNGTAKITNVPAALKNQVAMGLGYAPEDAETVDKFVRDARDIVDRLLTTDIENVRNAVGPVSSKLPTVKGGSADVEADVARLRAILTKDNLKVMKGLGSMSNVEFANLQNIADSLVMSRGEKGFIDELKRVQKNLNPAAQQSSQTPVPGTTRMTGPQGIFDVPNEQVETFKQNGYN